MIKRIWRGNRLYLINVLDSDAKNLSEQVLVDRLNADIDAKFGHHRPKRRRFLFAIICELYHRIVFTRNRQRQ